MSQSQPLIVVGAVVAVSALLAVVWVGRSDDGSEALEARVAALETEVATLRAEVERGGRRGPRAGRGDGEPRRRGGRDGGRAASGLVEDTAREIGRRARSAEVDEAVALDPEDPVFQETVGAVVREQLEEEREERWERRREQMEARAAERLDRFAADAGLDRGQVDELDAALARERDEIFAMFRAAREDGSWDEVRTKAEARREQTDGAVRDVLDATQLDAWEAFREEEASRRGR